MLLGLLGGQREKIQVCIDVHVCTHLNIYLFVDQSIVYLSSMYLSGYVIITFQTMSLHTYPQSNTQGLSQPLPFPNVKFPLATVGKLAFIIHITFTYLLNHRTRKADSESLTTSIMKNELVTRIKYVFTVKCVISLRYIVKIMCSRAIWFNIHPPF